MVTATGLPIFTKLNIENVMINEEDAKVKRSVLHEFFTAVYSKSQTIPYMPLLRLQISRARLS